MNLLLFSCFICITAASFSPPIFPIDIDELKNYFFENSGDIAESLNNFILNQVQQIPTSHDFDEVKHSLSTALQNSENITVLSNAVVDQINEVLKELIASLKNIPQPTYIPSLILTIPDNTLIRGIIQLSETILDVDFDANITSVGSSYLTQQIEVDINIKKLILQTVYKNILKLGDNVDEYISNNGKISVVLTELSLLGNFVININIFTRKVTVRSIDLALGLQESNIAITGFLNDEEMSEVLSKMLSNLPILINVYLKESLSNIINTVGKLLLESILTSLLFPEG